MAKCSAASTKGPMKNLETFPVWTAVEPSRWTTDLGRLFLEAESSGQSLKALEDPPLVVVDKPAWKVVAELLQKLEKQVELHDHSV